LKPARQGHSGQHSRSSTQQTDWVGQDRLAEREFRNGILGAAGRGCERAVRTFACFFSTIAVESVTPTPKPTQAPDTNQHVSFMLRNIVYNIAGCPRHVWEG